MALQAVASHACGVHTGDVLDHHCAGAERLGESHRLSEELVALVTVVTLPVREAEPLAGHPCQHHVYVRRDGSPQRRPRDPAQVPKDRHGVRVAVAVGRDTRLVDVCPERHPEARLDEPLREPTETTEELDDGGRT